MFATNSFNIKKIRSDFPILSQKVNGKPLIYFDNAATTQKPKQVIDKLNQYYSEYNSNIHRSIHKLAQIATEEYEKSREIVKEFINANSIEEIIFTKGTTDSINLVANSFCRKYLKKDDSILLSNLEHHSNIVPWQILADEMGFKIDIIPVNDSGELIIEEFDKLLLKNPKLVSIVHLSNAIGIINPIEEIIQKAHKIGAKVFIDAAQSIHHLKIDLEKLNCDFLAFSGHKIYGPTGVGVLYGKKDILNDLPPYQGGGEMIKKVSFSGTTFNDLPLKFEAGTSNISGVIGLGEAINYINSIGFPEIIAYEKDLYQYARNRFQEIPGFRQIGISEKQSSVISFIIEGKNATDITQFLDINGIAVRTGHHCTQPLMERFGLEGTCRASFSFYNTKEEIDTFVEQMLKILKYLD